MTSFGPRLPQPVEILEVVRQHPKRLLVPILLVFGLTCIFCFMRPRTWEAYQALIIRDAASSESKRVGSVQDVGEMKTVQETINELCRSRSVLYAALEAVGPPAKCADPAAYPDDRDIATLREHLAIGPPDGAEFGKTEVFYLRIDDHDRSRAIALVDEVSRQLAARFNALRTDKAGSMINELERAVDLAEGDLAQGTRELATLEKSVGVDLADLRMLHTSGSASSDLRTKAQEIETELRTVEADTQRTQSFLALLQSAKDDPSRLIATPSALLSSQPTLARLKDGLVDAQLNTALLSGRMAPTHPSLQAAKDTERQIKDDLHQELGGAIRTAQADLKTSSERLQVVRGQLATHKVRMERLASLRAEYAALVAKVENRSADLEKARSNLGDARAKQAASQSVSLISRIDRPETGLYPAGPSNTILAAAGLFAGTMLGAGILFLTTNLSSQTGQGEGFFSAGPSYQRRPFEDDQSFRNAMAKVRQLSSPTTLDETRAKANPSSSQVNEETGKEHEEEVWS